MEKEVQNWVDSACYDLETAEQMFKSKRYIYTAFMCHLALEKILKAKIQKDTGKVPPKTHDLKHLAGLSGIHFEKESEEFLAELSNLNVITRYPADFQQMLQDFSQQRAEKILKNTKEIFQWIKKSYLS